MMETASKGTRELCQEHWGLMEVWTMEGSLRDMPSWRRAAWESSGPLQLAAAGTLVTGSLCGRSLRLCSGIISPLEEWEALGLWHLMCDVCPRFPLAVPATYMGISRVELGEDEWCGRFAGFSTPSTAPGPATGPQATSLQACVSVGERKAMCACGWQ